MTHRVQARELLIFLVALVVNTAGCGGDAVPTCGPERDNVISVIDGDTITLESGERIRYWFVNTPELGGTNGPECFAEEAREANRRLVDGLEVSLEYPSLEEGCRDRYDRLLALVTVDGMNVNKILVERGYAKVESYGDDHPILGELEYLEEQAQTENKGLWGACQ